MNGFRESGGAHGVLTTVFHRSREASGSGAIVSSCYFFTVNNQRAPVEVLPLPNAAVGCLCVHTGQVTFHLLCWKHVDVLEAKRLKYVFLEVVVQRHARHSFNHGASPVNANLT